jgi:carbamate kinase
MSAATAVVAFGGNAITRPGERGTVAQQRARIGEMAEQLVAMLERQTRVVATHGNGPQVGAVQRQQELARRSMPPMPLDVCGAMTVGHLGYLLQQALENTLRRRRLEPHVVTLVTQTVVRRDDPAFRRPTKPVGAFLLPAARRQAAARGWKVGEDAGRGYRRLVPSPEPQEIVELDAIRALLDAGYTVIACGGGGVPVVRDREGLLRGVEAVIDKDLAAACLGAQLRADWLVLLTDQAQVQLGYGTEDAHPLERLSREEARRHARAGEFAAGSMGPKIEAALRFLDAGGRRAIITTPRLASLALAGAAGTTIE